jgi:hypothetical protein
MHLWINAKTFLKLRYVEERDLELAMLTLKLGSMIHRSHDGITILISPSYGIGNRQTILRSLSTGSLVHRLRRNVKDRPDECPKAKIEVKTLKYLATHGNILVPKILHD